MAKANLDRLLQKAIDRQNAELDRLVTPFLLDFETALPYEDYDAVLEALAGETPYSEPPPYMQTTAAIWEQNLAHAKAALGTLPPPLRERALAILANYEQPQS
jgi:hypothetical protein